MKYRHYYCTPKPNDLGEGYYGYISGTNETEVIEEPTIDKFEEEFHRRVDEMILEKEEKKSRRTRRTVIWCCAFAVLILSLVLTCPGKDKHEEALVYITSGMMNDNIVEEFDEWYVLEAIIGCLMMGAYLESSLSVDNYIIFSIGKISLKGEEKVVSIGFFNHVRVIGKPPTIHV